MDGNGDVNSGQLLLDIKAISKALYLPRISPESLISQSSNRSKSAGKSRHVQSNLLEKEMMYKERKSTIWNWKKPLKALTHIRNRKFNCTFFLHVHSVEGMPSSFDGISLCVHWRRKDNLFRTPPSKVSQGVADFEETLIHKCTVYGQRNGPHHFAKYEERLFLLYVSVVGAPGLDVGKHWVDLTRLLPPTLEELEDEKSSGKWTTTFRLSGRAKGATLNVSFGYSLMGSSAAQPSDLLDVQMFTSPMMTGPSVLSEVPKANAGDRLGMLSHAGRDPNNTNPSFRRHSESVGVSGPRHARDPKLELSRSIKYLYQKFDEVKSDGSKELNCQSEDLPGPKGKHRVSSVSSDEHLQSEYDDIDFTVVDRGIETNAGDQLKSTDNSGIPIDAFATEDNHTSENEQRSDKPETNCNAEEDTRNQQENGTKDRGEGEEINASNEGHESEKRESECDAPMLSDSFDVDNSNTPNISMEQTKELGSSFNSNRLVRSFSLDDLAEAVADDFLNMLGADCSPFAHSSDSEPGSPRERLLRQFEMEAAASGNYMLDVDADDMDTDGECDTNDYLEDFRLTVCQAPEKYMKRTPSLMSRRKAKAVEKLETEDLMKKWGLNETTFIYSPHRKSGGFGSPIYCSDEETVDLPSLGDGFGPIIQTRDGGFLRSISPSIFRAAKNNSSLIMQVTSQMVLPAELGTGVIEILQHLASLGVEKFCAQTSKRLPLENITGKTMQQVAWEAASVDEMNRPDSAASVKHNPASNQELNEYTSLEELAPLAMDNVEALVIEGLRIQSNMPSEEAPSSIHPSFEKVAFRGLFNSEEATSLDQSTLGDDDNLLSMSLRLDEWFRLDAGIPSGEEDCISEHSSKLLAAHHAKVCGDQSGLLGNNLMIALRVQLRDPFRHFEPVGGPVLVLIHVNRVHVSPEPGRNILVLGTNSDGIGIESKPSTSIMSVHEFKIMEVHVAGIDSQAHKKLLWASTMQQQYGIRWLMSSGMNKPSKTKPSLNSKEMVRYTPPVVNRTSPQDKLWSISYSVPEKATNLDHFRPANSFIRNPDIIFAK
uniref:C2 NT-type domain-containing protein n=1 Tax=Kalanchoe fedtschenkoi TaxID=63787 RepID=A0A7N0UZN6_KALFE